jgi:hypothetical protein
LFECRDTGLTFWIIRRPVHEYADAPRLDLLCAHAERPCRGSNNYFNEIASSHWLPLG